MKKTFCPYRVCPIGAHIDHQFGPVTGFAIDKGIEIEYEKTNNGSITLTSAEFEKKAEFSIKGLPELQHDWADYLRGAVASLSRKFELSYGIKAHIKGSLPIGGLSSSAAFEGVAARRSATKSEIEKLFDKHFPYKEKLKLPGQLF